MLELSRYRPEQRLCSQILGPLATNRPCLSNQSISKTQWLLKEMQFLLHDHCKRLPWRSTAFPGGEEISRHAWSCLFWKAYLCRLLPFLFPLHWETALCSAGQQQSLLWRLFFFFFFKKEQSVWGHPQAVQDAAFTVLQVWHLHGFDSVKVIAAWNLKSWGLRRLGWQIQLPYFRSYCPVAIGTWEVCFSVAWNQSPVL